MVKNTCLLLFKEARVQFLTHTYQMSYNSCSRGSDILLASLGTRTHDTYIHIQMQSINKTALAPQAAASEHQAAEKAESVQSYLPSVNQPANTEKEQGRKLCTGNSNQMSALRQGQSASAYLTKKATEGLGRWLSEQRSCSENMRVGFQHSCKHWLVCPR